MPNSWLKFSLDSPFSLANIPFGIISTPKGPKPRAAIAIGDYALDLPAFAAGGGFSELGDFKQGADVFSQPTLNLFAAMGRKTHSSVRSYLQEVLTENSRYANILQNNQALRNECLILLSDVKNHLPMQIGDYTDFYAGLNHAFNAGSLFRGPDDAIQSNYPHLPIGYHGRASSVVVSGTPIVRPCGQFLPSPDTKQPIYSPSRRLDFELELGAFVCADNDLGSPVPISQAESHIFGYALLNDWSARDIQAWEGVPLGPFNSKNFASTLSPWVVLADALEPFRTAGMRTTTGGVLPNGAKMPDLLPYLRESRDETLYDISLTVTLRPQGAGKPTTITRTNASNLLFSMPQMLAHHSVTGCPMRVGDLLGSGTISGPESGTLGSLLEQTKGGKELVTMESGGQRRFLEDHDEVVITGVAGKEGAYVGFGECRGVIMPARPLQS